MKKQRIKPGFSGLKAEDYFQLRDCGLTHQAMEVLRKQPAMFFANFQKYVRTVPDEFKPLVYSLCFQIATNPDRTRIESLVYQRKTKKKEVKYEQLV